MSEQYNNLLEQLKQHSESSRVSIWIPTMNKSVEFKPLTVKQQTDIIAGVLSSTKQQNIYAYQNIVDQIILSNCDEQDKISLAAIDRNSILVQIRMFTMGETLQIDGTSHDLKEHVDSYSNQCLDTDRLDTTVEYQGIKVYASAPRLLDEYTLNNQVPDFFKNTTDHDSVGKVFLIELAKYIVSIDFDGNAIKFEELDLKQKTQICEMLPMTLSQKIVEFVENVRELEQPYLNITTDQGSVEIPIDSQLFDR